MHDQIQENTVQHLLSRLSELPDHPRFTGASFDLSLLDAGQLGSIWPAMRHAQTLEFKDPRAQFAHSLCKQIEEAELVPVLDEFSALEVFRHIKAGQWEQALRDLSYLAEKPAAPLQQELIRILETKPSGYPESREYKAYAISHFAGGYGLPELRVEVAERYKNSPYRLLEFDVLAELSSDSLLALAGTINGYFMPSGSQLAIDDPAIVLADEAAYIEFARETLLSAAQHVNEIQTGKIAYKADAAFSTDDAQVISRAARVAAYRDEPWLRPIIGPLLEGVCVAPTTAKTVPSQSVAITLGHSIEVVPTPESVRALRDALALVRHAGIKKKLSRNVKPAERALAERPSVALRMTADAKPGKKHLSLLASCMESGYWLKMALSVEEWRKHLVDTPAGAAFANSVVWLEQRQDGRNLSFTVTTSNADTCMTSADGTAHVVDHASTISLWHPLAAIAAERHAWQSIFFARKIKQPLRQVFREHYVADSKELSSNESSMFEGHIVSIRPLIGLARKEGWSISKYEGLSRQFGDVRANFDISADLYPGATGYGTSGKLRFAHKNGKRWEDLPIADLDIVIFSEVARAVDLLVSVTSFATDNEANEKPVTAGDLGFHYAEQAAPFAQSAQSAPPAYHPTVARWRHLAHLSNLPLGVMASNRKNTLAMVLARQIKEGKITLDERHVHVGEYAIHIATARVMKGGEPIEIAVNEEKAQLAAMPWLPYDEILLQRILDNVARLMT